MGDANPRSWQRILLLVGRLALGAVFLYAAYTKLLQVQLSPFHIQWRFWTLFALSIDSYQLLPGWAVIAVARTLPWLELALGLLLFAGYQLRFVATAASALLLVFFGVMVRAYFKGLGIDCGCFGVGEALGPKTLLRDSLLLGVSLGVTVASFLVARKTRKLEDTTPEAS